MTAKLLKKRLREKAHPKKAKVLMTFFKTGPGEYGEGDQFIGVKMPEIRALAKGALSIPLTELVPLLESLIHEERMLALIIITLKFERHMKLKDLDGMKSHFEFYLTHRSAINNWDLVDVTAPTVVGGFLFQRDHAPLKRLARSNDLWERRISIVATHYFIRKGEFTDTLTIAKMLLKDPHDLIHKATGWMLREVGKRDQGVLTDFLNSHSREMPRTMLRYAIERLPEKVRKSYLLQKKNGRSSKQGITREIN